jgi:hypothetical protein
MSEERQVPDGALGTVWLKNAERGTDLQVKLRGRPANRDVVMQLQGKVNGWQVDREMALRLRGTRQLGAFLSTLSGPEFTLRANGETNDIPFTLERRIHILGLRPRQGAFRLDLGDGTIVSASLESSGESGKKDAKGDKPPEGEPGDDPGDKGGDNGDKGGDNGGDNGGSGGGGGGFWDILGLIVGGVIVAVGVLASMPLVALGGVGLITMVFKSNLEEEEGDPPREGPDADGGCIVPAGPDLGGD